MQAPYQCIGSKLQSSPLVGPWPWTQPCDFRDLCCQHVVALTFPTTWSKAWPYDLLPPKEPERSDPWKSQETALRASVCFITGAGPLVGFRSRDGFQEQRFTAELRSRGPYIPGCIRAQPGTTRILDLLITTASPTVSWRREKDTTSVLPVIPLFSPPLKRIPGPLGAEGLSISLYLVVAGSWGGNCVMQFSIRRICTMWRFQKGAFKNTFHSSTQEAHGMMELGSYSQGPWGRRQRSHDGLREDACSLGSRRSCPWPSPWH